MDNFNNAVSACSKYPLTIKPYLLNKIKHSNTLWNK